MASVAALIVALVVGHPVPVRCEYHREFSGYWDGKTVILSPFVCADLSAPGVRAQGVALFQVIHEAEHARGVRDEHAADCAALPLVAPFARLVLHASNRRSVRMAMAAFAYHKSLPAAYSGPCS